MTVAVALHDLDEQAVLDRADGELAVRRIAVGPDEEHAAVEDAHVAHGGGGRAQNAPRAGVLGPFRDLARSIGEDDAALGRNHAGETLRAAVEDLVEARDRARWHFAARIALRVPIAHAAQARRRDHVVGEEDDLLENRLNAAEEFGLEAAETVDKRFEISDVAEVIWKQIARLLA